MVLGASEINILKQDQIRRFEILDQQGTQHMVCGLTPAQIKHYLLLGASGGSMLLGVAIAVSPIIQIISAPFPLAIIFIAAGSFLFAVASRFYDYDDPERLTAYRTRAKEKYENLKFIKEKFNEDVCQEAKRLLDHIADEHGWENMFYFGIPAPTDFIEIYNFVVDHMSINEQIAFYERVNSALQRALEVHQGHICHFEIPKPGESLEKWKNEVRNLKIHQILKRYDLQKLIQYEILTGNEVQLFLSYQREYQRINTWVRELAQENFIQYKLLKEPLKDVYLKKIQDIENIYENHSAQATLSRLLLDERDEIGKYRHRKEEEIQSVNRELEYFRLGLTNQDSCRMEDLDVSLRAQWNICQNENAHQIERIEQRYEPIFREIYRKYTFFRAGYVRQLAVAKQQCDQSMIETKAWYANSISPLKERRNQLLGEEVLGEYRRRLDQLHQTYQSQVSQA